MNYILIYPLHILGKIFYLIDLVLFITSLIKKILSFQARLVFLIIFNFKLGFFN